MPHLHRFVHPSALLAVAGCCLGLIACGGSDSGSESDGAGSASSRSADANARDAAQTRLRNCLQKQGIDVPTGAAGAGGAPPDVDSDAFQAAVNGPCKKDVDGAFGNFDPTDPATQDRITKFSQCMRDNGVDVPDLGAGGRPAAGAAQIDRDDPKVQDALSKCQGELGNLPGAAGGN